MDLPKLTPSFSSSYSSHSQPQQQPSPIHINLARPKCFCGFTSVSIYPEPSSSSSSSSFDDGDIRKTNWVYECHFTPKQRGMVRPEPCEDCEEDRERILARAAKKRSSIGTTPATTTTTTTTTRIMTTAKDYMEDRGSGLRTGLPRLLLHQTEKVDQVVLWPSLKKSSSAGQEARTAVPMENGNGKGNGTLGDRGMTAVTAATVPVGGELGRMATFQGLSSADRLKVCGFHMHALEWRHMQTVGLDEILATARQAKCDVFNLSVIRWLGDNVRTSVVNSSNNSCPSSITNNNTGLPASFPFNRTTPNKSSSNTGLGLKLFHKISCDCGAEAVIAKGPTIASSYRPPSKEKQFLVVCRGRALTDPKYEIVDPSTNNNFYAYHDHDRSRLGLLGAKIPKCKFSISIDIAIFWSHNAPIHSRIKNNEWLAQCLSPPPSADKRHSSRSSSLPILKSSRSSRLSRPVSASSPISQLPPGSIGGSVSPSPRLSDLMVSSIQKSLTLGETSTRQSSRTTTLVHTKSSATPTTTPARPPPSRLLTARDFGTLEQVPSILPNGGLIQEQQGPQDGTRKMNDASRLVGLDKELEETVAWHVAEVTSIMEDAAQDHWSSPMSTQDGYDAPAWQQYSNYNEIDMTEYPGIAMHLCQWCKDNARDFCVVPSLKNQPDRPSLNGPGRTSSMTSNNLRTGVTTECSLPPSPPQSPDGVMDTIESYTDRDAETTDTYTELGRVDRELERVMLRHAAEVQETMKSRARLSPALLLCRGCELRTTTTTRVNGGNSGGRDVLPCCHALLCIECVETVEFYLVPRTTTATGRSSSGYGPGYELYE